MGEGKVWVWNLECGGVIELVEEVGKRMRGKIGGVEMGKKEEK